MYLELASLHVLIASCHCFASYTIFQDLFDATNATTAPSIPASTVHRQYKGLEEIMPLSRAEIHRALVDRQLYMPLTERPRITSQAKPKLTKRTESRKMSVTIDPWINFSLAFFEPKKEFESKKEVPTTRNKQWRNDPTVFDDPVMPGAGSSVAVKMKVTHPKSLKRTQHLRYKTAKLVNSTVVPRKVEETNKSVKGVANIDLSVNGLWNWMFNNSRSTTSVMNGSTVVFAMTTTTSLRNSSLATTPSPAPPAEEPASTTPFVCPDQDSPSNIGPYEVPTERDLVLLTKTILLAMFDSYHQKTFQFLRDIKEASKAAIAEAQTCVGDMRRIVYRQCLREISSHYEQHIKKLVNTLETDRHEIKGMTEGSVCSLNDMKKDPVHLIKTLAVEEVSLQFAFPGFLRLISSCRRFCDVRAHNQKVNPEDAKRSKLKLNLEKEAMLKYMLTQNNYLSLRNKNN